MERQPAAAAAHWESAWDHRDPDSVSWFQEHPDISLRFIGEVSEPGDAIIDVGGGASRLVDHLLDRGYDDLTVLDVAPSALDAARERLGSRAARVRWICADITEHRFDRVFDVWHDRAVLHFLVERADRERYLAALRSAVDVDGHVVLATFGPDGPDHCSGLPVRRYDVPRMERTLGDAFELVDHQLEHHVAPSGITQQFQYALFQRLGRSGATAS